MHQHWKATLMSVNITTLLRHAQQTDNWDMFGAWRPPQHHLQLAA